MPYSSHSNKRIFILDDHTLYLNGLNLIVGQNNKNFDIELFSTIAQLKERLNQVDTLDLIISDIELPGEDIYPFLQDLKSEQLNIPVLVISMHKKLAVIRKCKKIGVDGYILKDDDTDLLPAINTILKGGLYYSKRVEEFFESAKKQTGKLSPREESIVALICQGFSNQEIAEKLFISTETVKTHKKNIRKKFGVKSNSEIIHIAMEKIIM